jgi:hypothetical protein
VPDHLFLKSRIAIIYLSGSRGRSKLGTAIVIFSCLVASIQAAVQITRLNPPIEITPFFELEDPTVTDPLAIDFNNGCVENVDLTSRAHQKVGGGLAVMVGRD